jgi:hypothetical protein
VSHFHHHLPDWHSSANRYRNVASSPHRAILDLAWYDRLPTSNSAVQLQEKWGKVEASPNVRSEKQGLQDYPP